MTPVEEKIVREGTFSLPSAMAEEWRFSERKQCDFLEWASLPSRENGSTDLCRVVEQGKMLPGALALNVHNGVLVSVSGPLPEGFCIYGEGGMQVPELFAAYMMERPAPLGLGDIMKEQARRSFASLLIHVAAGVELAAPIHVVHCIEGSEGIAYPSVIIVCEEGAKLTVVESWISEASETAAAVIAYTRFVLNASASLQWATLQGLNKHSKLMQATHSQLAENASLRILTVNTGAQWVRQELDCSLSGAGASALLLGVNVVKDFQIVDQRTYQRHESPETRSDLIYKNTLSDNAKTIFSGMIQVAVGAHFTDAFQRCHNLLLSEEATAHSLPGLEIKADQVKCSHGATNSTIQEEELFYLLSRGIKPAEATELIAQGFSAQVLEKFEIPAVSALAEEMLAQQFLEIKS